MGDRILVVDDEPAVLRITARLLVRMGYDVVTAANSRTALGWIESSNAPLEAAIVDHTLWDLDGPKTVEALRSRRPGLPVLVASGVNESSVLDGYPNDRVLFLPKPFDGASLHAALRRLRRVDPRSDPR